jgi:hypothetical protein
MSWKSWDVSCSVFEWPCYNDFISNEIILILQIKVVLPMHIIMVYRGMEVTLHTFCNSTVDEGKWLASFCSCFTPKEGVHGTHCI